MSYKNFNTMREMNSLSHRIWTLETFSNLSLLPLSIRFLLASVLILFVPPGFWVCGRN